MARRYSVSEPDFTASAASDLIQIKNAAGSNKVLLIRGWKWKATDNTLPTAQNIMTRCRRLPSTVTDGSGGGTPTPRPADGGDSAATFTAFSRNTVKATTSGTAVIVDESADHIYNGYREIPDEPIVIAPGQSFVFELTTAVLQGSPKINALVFVEEIG